MEYKTFSISFDMSLLKASVRLTRDFYDSRIRTGLFTLLLTHKCFPHNIFKQNRLLMCCNWKFICESVYSNVIITTPYEGNIYFIYKDHHPVSCFPMSADIPAQPWTHFICFWGHKYFYILPLQCTINALYTRSASATMSS